MAPQLALVGLGVGLLVGVTATGAGAVLTPILLALGIPAPVAVGSDVLAAAGMRVFGGAVYVKERQVHWPTVRWLATGSIPGAILGGLLLTKLPKDLVAVGLPKLLGVMMALAGVATLFRMAVRRHAAPKAMPKPPVTVALGFGTGFLVSLTSIGSGSLLMVGLVLLFPLSPAVLVGTDLIHAMALSSVATLGHLAAGRVDLAVAGGLLLGGIPGAMIGAKLAAKMPEQAVKTAMAVVLVAFGANLSIGELLKPHLVTLATIWGLR